MIKRAWLWAVPGLFAAALLIPQRSEACSCFSNGEMFVAPSTAQKGVPTNTKIWTGSLFGSPAEIIDQSGQLVPVTTTKIEGVDGTLTVYTPVQPLVLGQGYFVRANGLELSTFAVEVEADSTKPAPPVESGRESHSEGGSFTLFGGSSCGNDGSHYVNITLQHNEVLTVIDAGGGAVIDEAGPSGTVTTVGFEKMIFLGSSACIHNWAGAEDGDDSNVRYGSFDLAGNFSGWSEPTLLESPNSCACVAGRDTALDRATFLVFGTGALIVFISRRRRCRT